MELGFRSSFDSELGTKNPATRVRVLNVRPHRVVGFGFECEEDAMDVCIDMASTRRFDQDKDLWRTWCSLMSWLVTGRDMELVRPTYRPISDSNMGGSCVGSIARIGQCLREAISTDAKMGGLITGSVSFTAPFDLPKPRILSFCRALAISPLDRSAGFICAMHPMGPQFEIATSTPSGALGFFSGVFFAGLGLTNAFRG